MITKLQTLIHTFIWSPHNQWNTTIPIEKIMVSLDNNYLEGVVGHGCGRGSGGQTSVSQPRRLAQGRLACSMPCCSAAWSAQDMHPRALWWPDPTTRTKHRPGRATAGGEAGTGAVPGTDGREEMEGMVDTCWGEKAKREGAWELRLVCPVQTAFFPLSVAPLASRHPPWPPLYFLIHLPRWAISSIYFSVDSFQKQTKRKISAISRF
jgi:hypothetical protein